MPFRGQNKNRKPNILKIPRSFLVFEGADGAGAEVYVIQLAVDMLSAYQCDALSISVKAFLDSPSIDFNVVPTDIRMNEVGRALAKGAGLLSNRIKRRKRSQILSSKIDLTSAINNQSLNDIRNTGNGIGMLFDRAFMCLAPQPGDSTASKFLKRSPDRVCNPGYALSVTAKKATDSKKKSALINAVTAGVDPIAIFNSLEYKFPVDPPELKLQNYPSGNYSSTRPRRGSSNPGSTNRYGIIGGRVVRFCKTNVPQVGRNPFLGRLPSIKPPQNPKQSVMGLFSSAEGSTSRQAVELYKAKQSYVPFEVPVKFLIPSTEIQNASRVFFEFKLMSSTGLVVDRIVMHVNMSEVMADANLSYIAPTVSATRNGDGSTRIKIMQNDPAGIAVDLYRREIDLTKDNMRSEPVGWNFIASVNCTMNKHGMFVDTKTGATMTYMYRGIAVSSTLAKSNMFGSAVVKPLNETNPSRAPVTTRNIRRYRSRYTIPDVIMKVQPLPDGKSVVIRILNTSSSVSKFRLYARILRGPESGTVIEIMKQKGLYLHEGLQHGVVYEYHTECRTSDGTMVPGKSKVRHKFRRFVQNSVKTTISARLSRMMPLQSSLAHPSSMAVRINTGVQELEESFSDILQTMTKQISAQGSYADQIEEMKPRLGDIARVEVIRKDLTTGEEESFGDPIKPGTFSDTPMTRQKAGVSNLKAGHVYEYEFSLSKVSIENFLGNVKLDEKDEDRLIGYKKNASKFAQDGRGKSNTLRANSELNNRIGGAEVSPGRGSLSNLFSNNVTQVSTRVEVTIPEPGVVITQVRANFDEQKRIVRITWGVKETMGIVDSFIIMADIHGIKAPVGAVMPTSETTKTFSFRDTVLGDVIGDRLYSIVPVYNNFSLGTESDTVKVRIQDNLSFLEEVS